jgi:anhydro-N-acetylmuramic acid kinase
MIAVGLMSGTSADGIDAAAVDLPDDGGAVGLRLLAHVHRPYGDALRAEVLACCTPEGGRVDRLTRLHGDLGEAFAAAALAAMAAAGLTSAEVDLIGSHGQTVHHLPPVPGRCGATLQLGAPAVIAERTGVTVVSDFRWRDLAAGGHGAPLVPAFDLAFFRHPRERRALLNVGGMANVTWVGPAGEASGFDTGPGNVLLDAAAALVSGGRLRCDADGRLARAGRVHAAALAELMAHPFLRAAPPRSTGRETFGPPLVADLRVRWGLDGADLLATLTEFTAASIAGAVRAHLPPVDRCIVGGGGRRNPALMAALAAHLAPVPVEPCERHGLDGDAKEAVAFAYLARLAWAGRPGNVMAATGAARPVILGSFTPGRRWPP